MKKIISIVLLILIVLPSIVLFSAKLISRKPKRIIIISLDTLRPDHVHCLGYKKQTTPNIDTFAHDAIIVNNAFVPMPFTPSSHMSILTSLYPKTHGIYSTDLNKNIVPARLQTIGKLLQNHGYYTAGIVSSWQLDSKYGFSKGFDFYKRVNEINLTFADKVNEDAFKLLDILSGSKKDLFLFLHYYDIHTDDSYYGNKLPYYSPPEYFNAFVPEALKNKYHDLHVGDRYAWSYLTYYTYLKNERIPAETVEYVTDLYDAGIAYTDHYIGELFTALKKRNLYDDSLIVLLSDHGMEFGEHNGYSHDQPYDECIRMLLMIKLPKNQFAGTSISSLVESIDILPTILDYCGFKIPKNIQGRSFLDMTRHAAQFKNEVYSQGISMPGPGEQAQNFRFEETLVLRTPKYKLIYNPRTAGIKLYDLENDPGENTDIADRNYSIASALKDKIVAWLDTCSSFSKHITEDTVNNQ